MKTKKKSITTADLVVLSLLSEKPMHGYELVGELERRDVQDWASLSRPQVYYSLEKLFELGLIGEDKDSSASLGPERRIFRVYSHGSKAMLDALGKAYWATQRPPLPFQTWLALSTHLSKAKTKEIIETRKKFVAEQLNREQETLAKFEVEAKAKAKADAMMTAGKLMVSFAIASFQLELNWLEEVEKILPNVRI